MKWNSIFVIYIVGLLFLLKVKALLAAGMLLLFFPAIWSYRKQESQDRKSKKASMNKDEDIQKAMDILEIKGELTQDKVKDAYNRLIKQVHPDHGGSRYLTEQIMEAKTVLLKRLEVKESGETQDDKTKGE